MKGIVRNLTMRSRFLIEERRRDIISVLEAEGRVTVEELARRYGVSSVTIRSDLDALALSDKLSRSHGGALKRIDPTVDYPLKFKQTLNHSEKSRIGAAAAGLIQPNQTVILDSGTTTACIARSLKAGQTRPVTVITSALNIAMELAGIPGILVIMLGGILRPMSHSLVGPQAERNLANLRADQLFLGVDGLEPDTGITTPDILEANLNARMIAVSREVTVVADSTKLGKHSLSVIAGIDAIHRLITDTSASDKAIRTLQAAGVEVITV